MGQQGQSPSGQQKQNKSLPQVVEAKKQGAGAQPDLGFLTNMPSVEAQAASLDRLPATQGQEMVKQMEQTQGNRHVQRVMTTLKHTGAQAKLTVSEPGDEYELEADSVAEQVLRMPAPATPPPPPDDGAGDGAGAGDDPNSNRPAALNRYVQRAFKRIQPSGDGIGGNDVAPDVESRVQRVQQRGGVPMPESEREYFEPRMGVDLGNVQLHTDSEAVETSRDLNARAYTVGSHVAFGDGEYQPGTTGGRRLLAHELTHVVQQGGAGELQRQPDTPQTPSAEQVQRVHVAKPEIPDTMTPVTLPPEKTPEGFIASAFSPSAQDSARDGEPGAMNFQQGQEKEREAHAGAKRGEQAPGLAWSAEGAGPSRQGQPGEGAGPPAPQEQAEEEAGQAEQEAGPPAPQEQAEEEAGPSTPEGQAEQEAADTTADAAAEQQAEQETADQGDQSALEEKNAELEGKQEEAESQAQQAEEEKRQSDAKSQAEPKAGEGRFAPLPRSEEPGTPDYVFGVLGVDTTPIDEKRQQQEADAGQRLDEFISSSTAQAATLAQMSQTAQSRIEPEKGTAIAEVQAAVEENSALVATAIEQLHAQAETEAETARAEITAQYDAAVAAMTAATETARASIEIDRTTKLAALDTLEQTKTQEIYAQFTAAEAAVRQKAEDYAGQAIAIGESYKARYRQETYPEPGFFDGADYYERKREAKINAADQVAGGYADEFRAKGEETAGQLSGGAPDVIGELATKLNSARQAIEDEYTGAMTSLDQALEQSLTTAADTQTGQLQAVEESLTSTLSSLDDLETDMLAQIEQMGEQQTLAIETGAQQSLTATEEAIASASQSLNKMIAQLSGQAQSIPAPDPEALDAFLQQASAQFNSLYAESQAGIESQIATGEQQIRQTAQAGVQSITDLGQQGVDQATPIGENFTTTIDGLVQSATETFTTLQTDHTTATDQQVQQTLSNFQAAYDQGQFDADQITTCLDTGLQQFVTDFATGMDPALQEIPGKIEAEAQAAADKVQPAWKKVLAFVLTIIITVVVAVAIAALVASGVGLGLGLLLAAGIGALGGVAKGMINNWAEGEDILKDFWKNAALGALDGMLQFAGGRFVQGLKLPDGFKKIAIEGAIDAASGFINDVAGLAWDGQLTWENVGKALLNNLVSGVLDIAGGGILDGLKLPDGSLKKALADMGLGTIGDTIAGMTETFLINGEPFSFEKAFSILGESFAENVISGALEFGMEKLAIEETLTEEINDHFPTTKPDGGVDVDTDASPTTTESDTDSDRTDTQDSETDADNDIDQDHPSSEPDAGTINPADVAAGMALVDQALGGNASTPPVNSGEQTNQETSSVPPEHRGTGKGQIPCFPEGTLVSTLNGMRCIETIGVGEHVYAYDLATQSVVNRQVLATYSGSTSCWVDIHCNSNVLRATQKHPIWSESSKTWVEAKDLKAGMAILTKDHQILQVSDVIQHPQRIPQRTYNLTVEGANNFFAGVPLILVHNDDSRMNRTGYSNYVLKDKAGNVYYTGMFGPNDTQSGVERRHAGNNDRYDPANGDHIEVVPGTRTYAESRRMEHELCVIHETYIGRDGDNYRGNRQYPMSDSSFERYYPNGC